MFARLNTPLYPTLDNMFIDVHFFFVPYRLIWTNFKKFMGEQDDPGDSVDFTVPQITAKATTGFTYSGVTDYLYDHMGIPYGVPDVSFSALPFRAYSRIYNEWFRDQNLINSINSYVGDGPDTYTVYTLQKRGKRHDYFTSCLPWLQKGDGYTAYAPDRDWETIN